MAFALNQHQLPLFSFSLPCFKPIEDSAAVDGEAAAASARTQMLEAASMQRMVCAFLF